MTPDRLDALCAAMHDAYEAAATRAGWETQARSRVPWEDVPEANKATMRVAVTALLPLLTPQDVPHVAAQVLRHAADVLVAKFGVTNRAAGRLRARADQYAEPTHRSAVDATTPPDTYPSDPRPVRNAQEGEQR